MSTLPDVAVELQTFVMVGQDELMMRGLRKPDTKFSDIDKINNAIKDYVEKRMELESNRSSAQWKLLTAAQNNVVSEALRCLDAVRVVQGHALWDAPSESPKPVQIQTLGVDTNTDVAQSVEPVIGKRPSTGSTLTGSTKGVQNTRSKAAPLRFGPPKVKKKANEDELWKKFLSYSTPPEQPSVEWLSELRDLVVDLGPANRDKVITKLGRELWCQLVFLNVHRGHSRTLLKTKVSKIDISNWDLIPTEAEAPCKTCGHKLACQWPNSEDHSKCRECHLQAKRCIFGGEDTKRGRKRKRSSKSPVTVRRRRLEVDMNTDMDEDEDGFSQDETLQQPTETPNAATYHGSTLNLQKVADSVKSVGTRSSTPKPPPLVKVPLKPGLSSHPPAPPFFNLRASTSEREQVVPDKTPLTASPPEHRVTLDRNSDVEPTTNLKNTSIITNPLPAFNNKPLTIHGSPTPSAEDPPEKSFPTLANEFFHSGKPDTNSTRPHGHPDHDEDVKLVEECQNDACKRQRAKITAERDSAREEIDQLWKKKEALLTFGLEVYQKALEALGQ